jgi:Holliday junction resolvase
VGRMSRTKGAAGERELAKLIRSYGFECERTGRNGRTSEDVTHGLPNTHVECKRDERLSVDAMVRQAERDAAPGLVPVVAFRRSRQPWRVVLPAAEYLRLRSLERDVEIVREGMRRAA